MGGGDLVSGRSLGGRGLSGRPTGSGDGNWRVREWVTMATQPCFREKGAVALERGPISGATEGQGGDLERCAKRVANGGGRRLWCLLAGTLPTGNSGRGWWWWWNHAYERRQISSHASFTLYVLSWDTSVFLSWEFSHILDYSRSGVCPILFALEPYPGVCFKPEEIFFMSTFLTSTPRQCFILICRDRAFF